MDKEIKLTGRLVATPDYAEFSPDHTPSIALDLRDAVEQALFEGGLEMGYAGPVEIVVRLLPPAGEGG